MRSSLLVIFAACALAATGQSGCLQSEKIIETDAQWENALLTFDVDFLESTLAKDFLWVHNHVSSVDTRDGLIKRTAKAKARNSNNTRSRKQREVQTLLMGSTCVVTGYTVVDRGPTPTVYNFMRTYAEVDGKCYLLANHTMAVPPEEE